MTLGNVVPTTDYSGIWEELESYIPESFSFAAGKITVQTGSVSHVEVLVASEPVNVPLLSVDIEGNIRRLAKPINLRVYTEGEWCFAENELLVLHGAGLSFQNAIRELHDHIVYFWNYYLRIQDDQLMTEGQRLKKIYSSLLIEEDRQTDSNAH